MKNYISIISFFLFSILLLNACITSKDAEEDTGGFRTDVSMTDTYWKITSVDNIKITTGANARECYLIMESDGNLKGFGGCNRFSGRYLYDASTIKLGPITSTNMACPAMDREAKLLSFLTGDINYEIKGADMNLLKNGKVVVTLEASAMK